MTELTKEELQEKIAQVKRDISRHRDAGDPRMIERLNDYIEYLEDEIKMLDKK